jgi:hypothetical protein
MKYRVILSLAALPFSWSSETSKPDQGKTVARMCGRVTDSEYTTRPSSPSYPLGPGRKKADVRLSGRKGQRRCAQNAFISEMPAGKGGGFKFKDSVPGEYWVVVKVGRKKYKWSVSLAARRKSKPRVPRLRLPNK